MHPTLQYIYDYVVEFALEQNAVSVDEEGMPAYDGLDGMRCFVGCLLKPGEARYLDKEYVSYRSIPLGSFLPEFTEGISEKNEKDFRELLAKLQYYHDVANERGSGTPRELWIKYFLNLSNKGYDPGILINWID